MINGELNFVLIGARSTGKTWYIRNLVTQKEVSAIGEDTINYVELISSQDEATDASYRELYFNYKDDKFNVEFQMDDYDGNFVETWHDSQKNKEYKEKLTEYVKESEGIFIFLEYTESDNLDKFKNMEQEIDVFIEKVKEEYGESHSELPIPIIFVVSQWDKSPDFQSEDEVKKAEEYIKTNPYLFNVKEKVLNHFAYSQIIPVSSLKKYNILKPIAICLEITFSSWEKTINELKASNNKIELLDYLSEKNWDMRFYKDGIYKKLYDELEEEFAQEYLPKLTACESFKKFEEFFEEYKIIFESLNENHQEEIANIRLTLEKKAKNKKIRLSIGVVGIVALCVIAYYKYIFAESEENLYKSIKTEYKQNNYEQCLKDTKKYYKIYNLSNKKHASDLKELTEQIKKSVRKELNEGYKSLQNTKSILQAYSKVIELKTTVEHFEIQGEIANNISHKFKQLKQEYTNYKNALNSINNLSAETVTKDDIDRINSLIITLKSYNEYTNLNDTLLKKIQSIKEIIVKQDFTSEEQVQKFIELASVLSFNDKDIDKLNKKLNNIKTQNEFNEFLGSLKNESDTKSMIEYIKTHWNFKNYTATYQHQTRAYLNEQFQEETKNQLGDLPDKIDNIDDYNRIYDKLKIITDISNSIKELPLNDANPFDINTQNEFDKKLNLFKKYSNIFKNGVTTTQFTLYIEGKNVLFETSFDKVNLTIYIDGISKYHTEGGEFHKYKTLYSNVVYKAKKYSLKILEKDILSPDDEVSGSFTISYNQLIKLYNTGYLKISLGDVYSIEIGQ